MGVHGLTAVATSGIFKLDPMPSEGGTTGDENPGPSRRAKAARGLPALQSAAREMLRHPKMLPPP